MISTSISNLQKVPLMKVLIVEDHPATRRMMRQLIESFADEVSECSDGAQALARYTATQPDWVLMDIRMKEMDGITATQQIKSAFPGAQIIIVTSFDAAGLREAAFEAGACGYVLKDNLSELQRRLQSV
jgi:CheY-like chemotaxis protein